MATSREGRLEQLGEASWRPASRESLPIGMNAPSIRACSKCTAVATSVSSATSVPQISPAVEQPAELPGAESGARQRHRHGQPKQEMASQRHGLSVSKGGQVGPGLGRGKPAPILVTYLPVIT